MAAAARNLRAHGREREEVSSFDLLDLSLLPPVLLRARMLVRCADEPGSGWLPSLVLLTEAAVAYLPAAPAATAGAGPGLGAAGAAWRTVPLVNAHVRCDRGSDALELSTAVASFVLRARHADAAAEFARAAAAVAGLHADHAALALADVLEADWREARAQEGLLGAAAAAAAAAPEAGSPRGAAAPASPPPPPRRAPRDVRATAAGALALDVPPWAALAAAERQFGQLSFAAEAAVGGGGAGDAAAALAGAPGDAEAMVRPGLVAYEAASAGARAATAWLGGAWAARGADAAAAAAGGGGGGGGGRAAGRPPSRAPPRGEPARDGGWRLMPAALREAVAATAASAPLVAASALLDESAAVAGAEQQFVLRALRLGRAGGGRGGARDARGGGAGAAGGGAGGAGGGGGGAGRGRRAAPPPSPRTTPRLSGASGPPRKPSGVIRYGSSA